MSEKPHFHWVEPSGNLPGSDLVEAIYETLVTECVAEEDPYAIYMNRVRSQLYVDPETTGERIAEGYRAILENLELNG